MAEVVIPVYGKYELLEGLADTLMAAGHEIILVDDRSPDEMTRKTVKKIGAKAGNRYIFFEENEGFPAAVNAGAKCVQGEFFYLMNTDVSPVPGAMDHLWRAMSEEPRIAAVAPMLISDDEVTVLSAGVHLDEHTRLPVDSFRYFSRFAPEVNEPRICAMLSHAAVLFRTRAFRGVRGYDESFGIGIYEDCDLSLRLLEAGWHSLYEPAAVFIHLESKSFSQRHDLGEIMRKSEALFVEKWIRPKKAIELAANMHRSSSEHDGSNGFGRLDPG